MHKLKYLFKRGNNMFIYVKKDEYHNPGLECYILKLNGQYSEREIVNCVAIYLASYFNLLFNHFADSCIGEGNGNPLQCSCLENPRDRGAWWAAIYGVIQSRT